MKLGEGVGEGRVIDPNHILQIVNALTGKTQTDIQINGLFCVTGSAFISQDLNVLGAITASKLIIDKNHARIGDSFIVNHNSTIINSKFIVKETSYATDLNLSGNLTVTGSVSLLNVPQDPNITTFLGLDQYGNIKHVTGSVKDYEIEKFKFNHIDTEDSTSFKGKINNISVYPTENIKELSIFSKLDIAPTWIKHNTTTELQNWILNKVNEDVFWIKITVVYKDHLTGKSEVIFKYSM